MGGPLRDPTHLSFGLTGGKGARRGAFGSSHRNGGPIGPRSGGRYPPSGAGRRRVAAARPWALTVPSVGKCLGAAAPRGALSGDRSKPLDLRPCRRALFRGRR